INTADGSAHSIIGVTENLSIEIDDIITEISFLVTNVTADVLLGLDWFNQSNATIDLLVQTRPVCSSYLLLLPLEFQFLPST
ncbi:unnamed protein product, partial [Brachionus calyciflorus]